MQIQVRRLDFLIQKYALKSPYLVKLDVETYEYEVLKGWGSQFPTSAIFLIEIMQEKIAVKLLEFFPEDKYQFWNIDDRNGKMRRVVKLCKSDFCNFLIVPISVSKDIESSLRDA
jgi:hypothetical protein